MRKDRRKIKFKLCRNSRFTIDGVTKTLVNWARYYKINYGVVYSRIATLGWDIRVALRRSVNPQGLSATHERIWAGDKYVLVPIHSEKKDGK